MKQIELNLNSNVEIEVNEDTQYTGIFVGHGNDVLKSKIVIFHRKPRLTSRVKIKAVVFDNSKFDLEGLVKINKGAFGTDTYLKIDCLVMSPNAFARAIPSLEILEDEVKGGHGATIGSLDPLALNYLKSKGISDSKSKDILVEAFINS